MVDTWWIVGLFAQCTPLASTINRNEKARPYKQEDNRLMYTGTKKDLRTLANKFVHDQYHTRRQTDLTGYCFKYRRSCP